MLSKKMEVFEFKLGTKFFVSDSSVDLLSIVTPKRRNLSTNSMFHVNQYLHISRLHERICHIPAREKGKYINFVFSQLKIN